MVSCQAAQEKQRVRETFAGDSEPKSIPLDATPGQLFTPPSTNESDSGPGTREIRPGGSIQHAAQATDPSDTIMEEAERYT